jgi:hypothetical protein
MSLKGSAVLLWHRRGASTQSLSENHFRGCSIELSILIYAGIIHKCLAFHRVWRRRLIAESLLFVGPHRTCRKCDRVATAEAPPSTPGYSETLFDLTQPLDRFL